MSERASYWNAIYTAKRDDEVSWFQSRPDASFSYVQSCGVIAQNGVIDVGAGTSRLVDLLLEAGFPDVSALDVSSSAFEVSCARLGEKASHVQWIVSDVTAFRPGRTYGVWHDRAVFHFLTKAEDRAAYVEALERTLAPGGFAIVATFASDGAEKCSGLNVTRYGADELASQFARSFEPVESSRVEHVTPAGRVQPFTFVRLVRR